jgi:hypothetical protein
MAAHSISRLYFQLERLVDPSLDEGEEVADRLLVEVYAGTVPLIARALDELLRVGPDPTAKPPGTISTYGQLLDACGAMLDSQEFATRFETFARGRSWLRLTETERSDTPDSVDLDHSLSLISRHYAAGAVAYWATQVLQDCAGAWQQLCGWLAKACGQESPTTEGLGHPVLRSGLTEADLIDQALQALSRVGLPSGGADAAQRNVGYWLNGQRCKSPKRCRRIPIVAVTTSAGQKTELPPAAVGDLVLELLDGPATGLFESSTLWNRPISQRFIKTLHEAYEAAWPDAAARPAVRWSVEFAGMDTLMPLFGPSHGLAAHVGFRVLRANLLYDREWVFSANHN